MISWFIVVAVLLCVVMSLILATLTYALRDFSRPRLEAAMLQRGRGLLLPAVLQHSGELAFIAGLGRLVANLVILLGILHLTKSFVRGEWWQYITALSISAVVGVLSGVTLPHAIALNTGEGLIASCSKLLLATRTPMAPLIKLLHAADYLVRRATKPAEVQTSMEMGAEIEAELLSVIEEGEKEGFMGEEAKEMIESVISFGGITAAQAMTTRPDIVALPIDAPLEAIREIIESSGHSRIPLFDGSIDHVVGAIYARDLIPFVGRAATEFDAHKLLRHPLVVPETKPIRDLLAEFRQQKVHIAIVLDEYGSTTGLVTIEDVIEELVGDISDEHEPKLAPQLVQLDDATSEVDARMSIYDFNRASDIDLPEEAGYDTVGGFVTTTMGKIPKPGETLDWPGAKFTVLESQPARVVRVKVERVAVPVATAH